MAFTYGFYNSQNSDRMYDATQVSELFDGLIKDGVFSSIGDYFATIPGEGLQVIVKTGRAWFNHTWNKLDTFLPLEIDNSDITLSRYDAVILEIGTSTRTNQIKIVKGVNSYNPVYPTLLNNDDVHQYPLAYVKVNASATTITSSNIEIMVGQSPCPFVTGILETADIGDMFNQWDGEFDDWMNETKADFDAWYSNIQAQLSGDVAANLQRQIDLKLNISDKATSAEVLAGTNDTKYVTPKGVSNAIDEKSVLSEVGQFAFSMNDMEETSGGKYLFCDGRKFPPSSYPELFDVIGYTFGGLSLTDTVLKDNMSERYSAGSGYHIVCEEDPSVKFEVLHPSNGSRRTYLRLIEGSTVYEYSYNTSDEGVMAAFFVGKTPYIVWGESYTIEGNDISYMYIKKIEKVSGSSELSVKGVLSNVGYIPYGGTVFLVRVDGAVYFYVRKASSTTYNYASAMYIFKVDSSGAYLLGSRIPSSPESHTKADTVCFVNRTFYIKENDIKNDYWHVSIDNPSLFISGTNGIPSGVKAFLSDPENANVVWSQDRTRCTRFSNVNSNSGTWYRYTFTGSDCINTSIPFHQNNLNWSYLTPCYIDDETGEVYCFMKSLTTPSERRTLVKFNFFDTSDELKIRVRVPYDENTVNRVMTNLRVCGSRNILTKPTFLFCYTYKAASSSEYSNATIGIVEESSGSGSSFSIPYSNNIDVSLYYGQVTFIRAK